MTIPINAAVKFILYIYVYLFCFFITVKDLVKKYFVVKIPKYFFIY